MTSPSEARLLAICAGLPAWLAGLLAAYWLSVPLIGIGGDEPHYQILAASIVRDADLDLRNNYAEDERTREIFGRIEPHVYPTEAGWMPYHTPGLGFVLAVPFELGGQLGSRLALSLGPVLLALVSWRWLRPRLSAPATAWLTTAVVMSLPAVFGATQIYPDLLGGFVIVGLAAWVWSDAARRSAVGWTSFWLVAGLVVWLHLKFAAPAAILAALGARVAWREVSAGRASLRRQIGCGAAGALGPAAMTDRAAGLARPLAGGSLLYQALLAVRWIPEPRVLFPVLAEALDERNSLFPAFWRGLVPSFYFWDYWTYLFYPPNLVWMAVAAGLLGIGVWVSGRKPPPWAVGSLV